MPDPLLELDYRPKLPKRMDLGIGIVGAGGIVQYAHLPAYRQAGFNVVGITDPDHDKARQVAQEHGIPSVYPDLAALLADQSVEIVDVAIYPWLQLGVVEQATAAGKHLLCQKPLSDDLGQAVRIVEVAEAAGVKLAVNQQMRWDAGIRYTKLLMDRGWLGDPTYATVQVHVLTDWSRWPWIYNGQRVEVLYHSIHYLDSLRFLLGSPDRVFSSGSRSPGEQTEAETRTLTVWEYASGLRVLVDVNHGTWQDDQYAILRLEGTDGIIKGTIGLMYNYPSGRPDTLEFASKRHYPGMTFTPTMETMWIPDAFVGPMASLMRAIEDDTEPETNGRDNLQTLQAVFAAYRSMADGRAVRPDEITA